MEKRVEGIISRSSCRLNGRSVMTGYKWHEVYKAALLETDWSKIEERIEAAEAALHARKHEFSLNHGGEPEENQAIEGALRGLSVLRDEAARWREKRVS